MEARILRDGPAHASVPFARGGAPSSLRIAPDGCALRKPGASLHDLRVGRCLGRAYRPADRLAFQVRQGGVRHIGDLRVQLQRVGRVRVHRCLQRFDGDDAIKLTKRPKPGERSLAGCGSTPRRRRAGAMTHVPNPTWSVPDLPGRSGSARAGCWCHTTADAPGRSWRVDHPWHPRMNRRPRPVRRAWGGEPPPALPGVPGAGDTAKGQRP
jgi:hypothetical protein